MPDKKTLTDVFTDVADAIREKKSSVEPICPLDFATEISTIEGGGEDPELDALMQEEF